MFFTDTDRKNGENYFDKNSQYRVFYMKIRFIEPGNPPFKPSLFNHFVYDKYIRTPSHGLILLATIAKKYVDDVLFYSESIAKVDWSDCFLADIIFIGMFTYQAERAKEIAKIIKQNSKAMVVFGGLHATADVNNAIKHCDYILLGEGDESIVEFINAIKNDKPLDCEGLAYLKNGEIINTGMRTPPENIDTVPDRSLCVGYRKATKYNTIWPQVHASRGCPHNCDYCAVVRHYGRKVRTRSIESVIEDIKLAIDFHINKPKRLVNLLWLTDDNFFADREWAKGILNAIIDEKIKYSFTIQARYDVGFDDEMLDLLYRAGFVEIAMGIEFIDDDNFTAYNKKSTKKEIIESIKNIQNHGLRVRGLFILGADNHKEGCGKELAEFVMQNNICGVLIQGMYFVPGTPVYEQNESKLLHKDWSKYNGNIVHKTKNMPPEKMQLEIITASKIIYSFKNIIRVILSKKTLEEKVLFLGESFWHADTRKKLKREIKKIKSIESNPRAQH
jgi:radical SAM superfamily enzyme YgiQ (UPF0313 family)